MWLRKVRHFQAGTKISTTILVPVECLKIKILPFIFDKFIFWINVYHWWTWTYYCTLTDAHCKRFKPYSGSIIYSEGDALFESFSSRNNRISLDQKLLKILIVLWSSDLDFWKEKAEKYIELILSKILKSLNKN